MGVEVLRCRQLHRVGEWPCMAWLSLHVLLYLGICAVGAVLWEVGSGATLAWTLSAMVVGVVWFSPLVLLVSVAAACCLGVLVMLYDARWYWFRLAAILLFAVPFPLFLLDTSGPKMAMSVAAVQLVTALLIVQPREGPKGWADRDPAMEDHRW